MNYSNKINDPFLIKISQQLGNFLFFPNYYDKRLVKDYFIHEKFYS